MTIIVQEAIFSLLCFIQNMTTMSKVHSEPPTNSSDNIILMVTDIK